MQYLIVINVEVVYRQASRRSVSVMVDVCLLIISRQPLRIVLEKTSLKKFKKNDLLHIFVQLYKNKLEDQPMNSSSSEHRCLGTKARMIDLSGTPSENIDTTVRKQTRCNDIADLCI